MITEDYFLAIDGDDVGLKLRNRIISNDLVAVAALSKEIDDYFHYIADILEANGFETIFCGGDSLLSHGNQYPNLGIFHQLMPGPCTLSIGISCTAEQAYLSLQLAKARGKRQIVFMKSVQVETIHTWPDN